MSEKEQLEKLKGVALRATRNSDIEQINTAVKAAQAIAAYGDAGIPALIEISESYAANERVKAEALDIVRRIKSRQS